MAQQGSYVLFSNPLSGVEIRKTGFSSISSWPTQSVVASRLVNASTIKELVAALDAYEAEVKATGKPYIIGLYKHPRCFARKISGFDKATERGGVLRQRIGNAESVTKVEA